MNEPARHNHDDNAAMNAYLDAADPLSTEGRARRDAMLPGLQAAVVRQARRRRTRRSVLRGVATLSFLVAAGLTTINLLKSDGNPHPPPHQMVLSSPSESVESQIRPISIVRVAPGALDRHIVCPNVDPADYLVDDSELVAALASIGRPTGLVRRQGKTWLTAAVTDAELSR